MSSTCLSHALILACLCAAAVAGFAAEPKTITIDATQKGAPISPLVYGQFIEHLGRCIYGGIWAEMIEDRKFLHPVGAEPSPWKVAGPASAVRMAKDNAFVNGHTPEVAATGEGASLVQGALAVEKGKEYTGRIWLSGDSAAAPVEVRLIWGDSPDARDVVRIKSLGEKYKKSPLSFKARASSTEARLEIVALGKGAFRVGAVSLMPSDNTKGMRSDVLALLKELNAPIYRWPGGNFVSGYDWRDGLGDPDRRPTRRNPLFPYRVLLSVVFLVLIAVANLRGVKESGNTFAAPTYFFLGMTVLTVVIGFVRYLSGTLGVVIDPPPVETLHTEPLTLFLLLRAFSNGTTALTGVECISNGVKAFKEPRAHNAAVTMIWMSTILGVLFVGIVYLLGAIGAVPSESETVISQLARTAFGNRGVLYLGTIAATTLILVLATNTAFAGFPALSAIIAEDGYMPRQLAYRGSRLVFSRGIATLTAIAVFLIILFKASVTALIPLWAVGVFLSFTLSQTGMARHWWKAGHPVSTSTSENETVSPVNQGWHWKLAINTLGAITTAIVTLIFAITKFIDGAWIIVILLPSVVISFFAIHRHYQTLAHDLSLEKYGVHPPANRHRVILPVAGIHRGTLEALEYALTLSDDVTAVHISFDQEQKAAIERKWGWWGKGVRLVVIESPYRTFLEPFLEYVDQLCTILQPNERLTIVVPQFNPRHWWHNVLHTQTAFWLRFALLSKKGIVITEVPYQVH